ncbi:MAG: membrane protein insertase YidC, partial [Halocynthiibacter sp.]
MDNQNKNLILAIVLSGLVMLVWLSFFAPERPVVTPDAPSQTATTAQDGGAAAVGTGTSTVAPAENAPATQVTAEDSTAAIEAAPRVPIATPRLAGSISLLGGRLDDLALSDYRQTLDDDSEVVTLFIPEGRDNAYYTVYGWAPGGDLQLADVPGATTLWQLESGDVLTPDSPVTLVWSNTGGQTFRRRFAIDENYMFSVTQSVENNGRAAIRMAPYGIIVRQGKPTNLKGFFIIHEGAIGMADGELTETKYKKMVGLDLNEREAARALITSVTDSGWVGFTDQYWMSTLIPGPGQPFTAKEMYRPASDLYLTEARLPTLTVAAGGAESVETFLFAGAKEWETIRNYERENSIPGFIDSIDWGWFFFLTKPIFWLLHT